MLKRGFNPQTGLHSFKSLFFYSTSAASNAKDVILNPLLVDFLVKSLGFSEDKAVSIATDAKVSRRFKSTTNPELVIDFLKNVGFNGSHIRRVVTRIPNVLNSDVAKTLIPKIRVFQELGFSGSDLGFIISLHPWVLNRSLKSHIIPTLEKLKSIFGSNEQLVSAMLKINAPLLLSSYSVRYLPDNLLLLQSYGLPTDKIKQFTLQKTPLLLRRTQCLEQLVKQVQEELRIPPTSGMFLHGITVMGMTSKERRESCIQVYRSYGWRETEISNLLRHHPLSLCLSEKTLRLKLKYFMENVGYGSDYLSKFPALLTYSMEKRIVP